MIATDRGQMEAMKGNSLIYGFFSSIAAISLTPCLNQVQSVAIDLFSIECRK